MAERVLASLLDVFKYSCYTDGIRRGHNIPTMGCSGFPDVGLSYFVHIVQIHIANPEQTGARSVSSAAMRRIPSCPAFIFPPSETASLSNEEEAISPAKKVLPLSGTTSLSNEEEAISPAKKVLPLSGTTSLSNGMNPAQRVRLVLPLSGTTSLSNTSSVLVRCQFVLPLSGTTSLSN